MVKIGIFTFHNQSNLGAVLQASALLNYLQNNYKNANVEIINYYPNNAVFTNSKFVHKLLSELKKIAEYIVDQDGFKRRKNFESYKKQYYVLSRDVYFGDKSLKKKKLEYDILISGSDQILNTTLTGKSVAYYLDFNTDAKKISYASSFGREEISDNETEYIKHKLINFSYLSMREQSGISIVDKLINKKANLVTDPVFLLEKKIWTERCNEKLTLPLNYIFVYSMEQSIILEQALECLKKEYELPVIYVSGSSRIKGNVSSAGPREFLRYIRDAEIVLTNSFHGTAFSLIFQKKFICVAHSKRNTRIKNIMNMIGEEKKIVDNTPIVDIVECLIDGSQHRVDLEPYIKSSKVYLDNAIRP